MPKLPIVKGIELKKLCEKLGFKVTRQRGTHIRMQHEDGRVTTIPTIVTKIFPGDY